MHFDLMPFKATRARRGAWVGLLWSLLLIAACGSQPPPEGSSSSSGGSAAETLQPTDDRIRYLGRVDVSAERALFDWAGTEVQFRLEAPVVDILLEDGANDYNVLIDDQPAAVIETAAGRTAYPIELTAGPHSVRVTKRNGPNFGAGQFLGLHLPQGGSVLTAPAAPARRLEFIGDSYTVGYGNEGPGLDCGGLYRPFENSYGAFASITARRLDAEAHLIAISGIGAARNYGDSNRTSAEPMPTFYGNTVKSRSDLRWDFESWAPDAVVIKLGQNDHSTEPAPTEAQYRDGLVNLIEQVVAGYGRLPIVLLADNGIPIVTERMTAVASAQRQQGNEYVHFVQIAHPPQDQLGCDYHPLTRGHEAMAAELAPALRSILGW